MTTTVLTLMGAALDQEMQTRGIVAVGVRPGTFRQVARADCEAIMARVLEKSAAVANSRTLTAAQFEAINRRNT